MRRRKKNKRACRRNDIKRNKTARRQVRKSLIIPALLRFDALHSPLGASMTFNSVRSRPVLLYAQRTGRLIAPLLTHSSRETPRSQRYDAYSVLLKRIRGTNNFISNLPSRHMAIALLDVSCITVRDDNSKLFCLCTITRFMRHLQYTLSGNTSVIGTPVYCVVNTDNPLRGHMIPRKHATIALLDKHHRPRAPPITYA